MQKHHLKLFIEMPVVKDLLGSAQDVDFVLKSNTKQFMSAVLLYAAARKHNKTSTKPA
jgi:hypothetical protein